MRSAIKTAFVTELKEADVQANRANYTLAWRHLERAHVLSQAWAIPHVRVHLLMLLHALRRRDGREVRGQMLRLLVAAPGSWLRRAPLGNTGGSDVGILTPMPIPDDLQRILQG